MVNAPSPGRATLAGESDPEQAQSRITAGRPSHSSNTAGPPLTAKLIEGPISAHFFPGYCHVDIFMGQRADEDVFPVIVNELEKGAAS